MSAIDSVAHDKNGPLLEAAAILLLASPSREMLTTNLNKSLFYLDLYCFRDLGHVATRSAFIALPEGPVVAKYPQRLIESLRKKGIAEQEKRGSALPVKLIHMPASFGFLGSRERAIAVTVAARFAVMTARQASEYSHENPGWKISYDQGLGAGQPAKPIDLHIALQQVVDDDDSWLDDPLSPSLRDSLAAADRGEGEAW